jgi:hypothetical protein
MDIKDPKCTMIIDSGFKPTMIIDSGFKPTMIIDSGFKPAKVKQPGRTLSLPDMPRQGLGAE